MATFTITTAQNIDELISKAGGDIYNVNGGTLTVDQDSRYGLNQTTSTSLGAITISSTLGGTVEVDGRYIRLIPYDTALSFTLQRATPVTATLSQIYTKIQYLLRQTGNINTASGTVAGTTASLLLNFVGESLKCGFFVPTNPQGGVWIIILIKIKK